MDWELEGRPRPFDDIHEFEVWVYGQVRRLKRVGNDSTYFTPGLLLLYTDCTHAPQNCVCNESDIQGWRIVNARTPLR